MALFAVLVAFLSILHRKAETSFLCTKDVYFLECKTSGDSRDKTVPSLFMWRLSVVVKRADS